MRYNCLLSIFSFGCNNVLEVPFVKKILLTLVLTRKVVKRYLLRRDLIAI